MKTESFKLGDTVINTAELPKSIRDSIDFFDKMNVDLTDIVYKQNILALAITAMKGKIQNDIVKHLQPDESVDATTDDTGEIVNDDTE